MSTPIFTVTGTPNRTSANPETGRVEVGFASSVQMTENTVLATNNLNVDKLSITGDFVNIWQEAGQTPPAGQVITGTGTGNILAWAPPPVEEQQYSSHLAFNSSVNHGPYEFYFTRIGVEGTAGVQQVVLMSINMYGTTPTSTNPIALGYTPGSDDFAYFTVQIPDGYTPLASSFPANHTYLILGTIPIVDKDYGVVPNGGFPAVVTLYRTDSGGPRYFIRIFLLPQISNTGSTTEYIFGSGQHYPFATDSIAVVADDTKAVSQSLTFTYLGENI